MYLMNPVSCSRERTYPPGYPGDPNKKPENPAESPRDPAPGRNDPQDPGVCSPPPKKLVC